MLRNKVLPVLLCVGLGSAGVAQAASVSYYLNQSNKDALLPDGASNYLKVTIDDHDAVDTVTFMVDVLPALSGMATSGFGIQSFGFNLLSGDTLTSPSWTLPSNWIVDGVPPPASEDGFGKFDVVVETSGAANRMSTLMFEFASNKSVAEFIDKSSNPAGQGNAYFAAHVAGFEHPDDVTLTSAYFGATSLVTVPVPAPLVLLASALVPLFGLRTRR